MSVSKSVAKVSTKKVSSTPKVILSIESTARPKYSVMVCEAILNLNNRGGSSKIAIGKYIAATYGNGIVKDSMKVSINTAIKRGMNSTPKLFEQHKQSFKIARGQTKNIKSQMAENKKTSKLSALKTSRKSRPLTSLITTSLTAHPASSTEQLIERLATQENVAETERLAFARSCKSILTRCFNNGLVTGDEKSWTAAPVEESKEVVNSDGTVTPAVRGRPRKVAKVAVEEKDEDPVLEEENASSTSSSSSSSSSSLSSTPAVATA
jgi:hypothetical protein